MALTISYVVPVHNDELTVAAVVRAIVARLGGHPGSEVLLVENGSTDGSLAAVKELASTLSADRVKVFAGESSKGLGNAWREGIRLTTGDLVVLTASDLPFGFSDLDEALALTSLPPLVLGSKAHPGSAVEVDRVRQIMSASFRLVRGLLLGLWQGDTQGTLLVNGSLVRRLLPELQSSDYLIGTEIVAHAVKAGVTPIEVAVCYRRQDRRSTVSPAADSLRMLIGVARLRWRLHRPLPAPNPQARSHR